MGNGKPGVMIYFETAKAIKSLDNETVGQLFKAIMEYAEDGVIPEFEGVLAAVWPFISHNIDKDSERYERIREIRAAAGRKGGKARASNDKQNQANEANASFDKQIKDRSFIFNIDKLDTDETAQQVQAASALARQNREVTIPEVDSYVYAAMAAGAGTKATPKALNETNIYSEILNGSKVMDDAEIPETSRVLIVTPTTYQIMKKSPEIVLDTDIGAEMRQKGVIGHLDGAAVVKVPANRLPSGCGFMLCHPSATVAPVKLEDYNIHDNTIYSSGAVVTGRVCYDAFVLDNKKMGIYYQAVTA